MNTMRTLRYVWRGLASLVFSGGVSLAHAQTPDDLSRNMGWCVFGSDAEAREYAGRVIAMIDAAERSDKLVPMGDIAVLLMQPLYTYPQSNQMMIRAQAARKMIAGSSVKRAGLTDKEFEAMTIYDEMIGEIGYVAGCLRSGLVKADARWDEPVISNMPDEYPFNFDILDPAQRWSAEDYRRATTAKGYIDYLRAQWVAFDQDRHADLAESIAFGDAAKRAAFIARWGCPPATDEELAGVRAADAGISEAANQALRDFLHLQWLQETGRPIPWRRTSGGRLIPLGDRP